LIRYTTLNGDDSLWARHLEFEVCVVWDGHELGEAQATEEGVVDAREVNDLEGDCLLAEVVWLAEGNVEPDEWRAAGAQLRRMPILSRVLG
jgi:hypothetical protein